MAEPFKHSYKVQPWEAVSLSVYNVGFQKCEPLYGWGPGVRDHFLIHYVLSGKGSYRTGGREYILHAGDAFLVYPDTEVYYAADSDDPWEYYWVGFSGSDAAPLLERTEFTPQHPVIFAGYGEELKEALLDIYQVRGGSAGEQTRMTGKLYGALALLMSKAALPEKEDSGGLHSLRQAERFIACNYSRDIRIEDVAEFISLSRSSLYRIFMQYRGESPKEYLARLRIRRACELLRETELSIGAIATSVGYSDNLYFSKSFHKIKGMTPTAFREKRKIDQ